LRCDACHQETMVDMERMETRPVSNLVTMEGFTCKHCHEWKPVFALTASLAGAMRKLNALSPTRRDFLWHFAKTLHKAEGVQKRGENYGAF